jgi:hypothetical protein
MKKTILALSLLAIVGTASAHDGFRGYRGGYDHGGCYGCRWVAPAFIGGVIGYELSRPRYYEPPVVVQQPIIIQQQPVYSVTPQPNCSVWTETQHSDGTITRTRVCSQ